MSKYVPTELLVTERVFEKVYWDSMASCETSQKKKLMMLEKNKFRKYLGLKRYELNKLGRL